MIMHGSYGAEREKVCVYVLIRERVYLSSVWSRYSYSASDSYKSCTISNKCDGDGDVTCQYYMFFFLVILTFYQTYAL